MTELTQQKCEACSKNSQPVTQEEIETLKPKVPEWEIIKQDDELRLPKSWV